MTAKKTVLKWKTNFPQTRFAFPVLFASLFFLVEETGAINKKQEFLQAISFLEKQNPLLEKQAQSIALKLKGKLPIIIASHALRSVALKWVQDFNENAKTLAAINLGAFVSYYLALLYKIGPETIPGNELAKKEMAK